MTSEALRESEGAAASRLQTREEYRQLLAEDRERLCGYIREQSGAEPRCLWLHPGWLAVRWHRVAHWYWQRGARKRARLAYQIGCMLTGSDIHPNARIGGGLLIAAPFSLNLSGVAGKNATFMPRAGMGIIPSERDIGAGPGLPVVGDGCLCSSAAGPLGATRIGDGAMLGPRCFRPRDVGAGMIAIRAVPCEIVERVPETTQDQRARATPACPHASLRASLHDLGADLKRHHAERTGIKERPSLGSLMSALLTNTGMLLSLHRVSHWLWRNGLGLLASLLAAVNRWVFKITIHSSACIGGGCFLPHPAGVVLHGHIGPNLTVFASGLCVPRGLVEAAGGKQSPRVGSDVVIGGQGMIVGPVEVGDHARVAATVSCDVDLPAGAVGMSNVIRFEDRPRRFGERGADKGGGPAAASRRELRAHDWRRLVEARRACGFLQRWMLRCSPANVTVSIFRRSEACHARGELGSAQLLRQINLLLTGADLDQRSRVGPGLVIPYPAGVSMFARAGRDLTLLTLAGIDPDPERDSSPAVLGDGVTVGHQSTIWGPVRIGNGVVIESGALAATDVPAGMCVIPPQVRVRGAGVRSAEESS